MTGIWRLHTLTSIATAQHFAVDGICISCLYLMSLLADTGWIMTMFVIYNVLAFMTQPLTGHVADTLRNRHWLLLSSVVLLAFATLSVAVLSVADVSVPWAFYAVSVLLGIGNSLFHVWGGKQVAETTANDIRFVGLFVSTGAMGLAVGAVFCSWALLFCMLLFLTVLSAVYVSQSPQTGVRLLADHPCSLHRFDRWVGEQSAQGVAVGLAWIVVTGLMLVVMLRSLLGEVFAKGIPGGSMWPVFLIVGGVSMMGKMAGGWLARLVGMATLLVIVALVVACCLCGLADVWLGSLVGLFAVNCTMPVTLYLAQAVMPGREGLAFGLLAAALIPGYLLALLP